jgi:hypothetical protein
MPRGVKKEINYAEEIQKIEMRITHHQNSIKELEEKRQILIQQKNEKDMNLLFTFLSENNISAEDLLQQLNLQKTA